MNRRQLAFLVLVNALVSLVIALGVVWVFEIRRPEAAEIAALYGTRPEAVLASTPAPVAEQPVSIAAAVAQADAPGREPPPIATPAQEQQQEVYVVRGGDSLVAIATRYGVTVDDIVRANNLANPDFVFSGQRLVIPGRLATGDGPTATPAVLEGVEIAGVRGAGNLEAESAQIVNESDRAFTLQGWQLVRRDGPVYTFGNVALFPGGSVRIHSRAGDDTSIDLYWGQQEVQWQSGAVAELLNERGALVHSFTVP